MFAKNYNSLFTFKPDVFKEFKSMFSLLDIYSGAENSYPPYNLYSDSADNSISLEIAVAGFSKDNITVKTDDGWIIIHGNKKSDTQQSDRSSSIHYEVKKISNKAFCKYMKIPEGYKVGPVHLRDGLLSIKFNDDAPKAKTATKTLNIED